MSKATSDNSGTIQTWLYTYDKCQHMLAHSPYYLHLFPLKKLSELVFCPVLSTYYYHQFSSASDCSGKKDQIMVLMTVLRAQN